MHWLDHSALIITDIQNHFLYPSEDKHDFFSRIDLGVNQLLHDLKEAATHMTRCNVPVIYLVSEPDGLHWQSRYHAPGEHGYAPLSYYGVPDGLIPSDAHLVSKVETNGFHPTGRLEELLKKLSIQHTLHVGLYTLDCVLGTAIGSRDAGFKASIVPRLCRDLLTLTDATAREKKLRAHLADHNINDVGIVDIDRLSLQPRPICIRNPIITFSIRKKSSQSANLNT